MNEQQAWRAVLARDGSHDGRFVYGVVTTGVYCRPSCPSRRPLRENVRFYRAPADAERDGLRACRRCRPGDGVPVASGTDSADASSSSAAGDPMQDLCRYIEAQSDRRLDLAELGRQAGLSPSHLQRRFKAAIGITPRQYAEACRLRSFKRELRAGESVTDAIVAAGFGSASRVYERVDNRLGMTPGQYRAGGQGLAISHATAQTPLGLLMMAATDRGLCFVQFGESEAQLLEGLSAEYPAAALTPAAPDRDGAFGQWMAALRAWLDGSSNRLDLPADVRGTAFQMKVWDYLCRIPLGEVRSYRQVAEAVGRPDAVRAVAGACAANRLAVVIPCHRVIRGDGGLGGYRWGIERKRTLLANERDRRRR